MKDNLKHDWNEIVAFHLSDDGEFLEELNFLLKLKNPTEEELLDVQFCRLSKDGANFLKRINEKYSISEKQNLLKKLEIFNTPHTVNGIPLTELPEFSAGPRGKREYGIILDDYVS